jgi:hypothetical protein
MIKKKLIFAASFIFIAWSVTSCDALMKKCQFCRLVTRDSAGGIVTEGSETEYCGVDLTAIKAIPPAPIGPNTAKYECR